jgi:hypothetical protein
MRRAHLAVGLITILLGACRSGPRELSEAEQKPILAEIVKASDEGTFDGKAASMALQNQDLAMACHFWQRSIDRIDRIEQLMGKLPADSQAKLTGIQGLVAKKPDAVKARASICPAPSPG